MKTIADIKRAFTLGSKWHTVYHKEFSHRSKDENGKEVIHYKDKDVGVREISIVQTTQVAFKTIRTDGTTANSWIAFPKAKEVKFLNENSFQILEEEGTPVLTYTKAEEERQQVDFFLHGGGTLYMLMPLSESAKQWIADHIPSDAQWLGKSVAIEHRYMGNILQGIESDGLTVTTEGV